MRDYLNVFAWLNDQWNDRAQISAHTGGIDFQLSKMNLQVQNNAGEIKFHVDPAMLQQLQNIPGFVPVIINIRPVNNLRMFLGLAETEVVASKPAG